MSRESSADKHKRNADGYFTKSPNRDELLKGEVEKGQVAEKDKIARLRAFRLEKEARPTTKASRKFPTRKLPGA